MGPKGETTKSNSAGKENIPVVNQKKASSSSIKKLPKLRKVTGVATITIPEKKKIPIKKKGSSSTDNDNFNKEYENIYNKVYQEVYQDISKTVDEEFNKIKSIIFTREEVIERINISGDRNKNLFTQQLTVLPQLVESVVEEYDRERLSKDISAAAKAIKNSSPLKIKYCKSDFLRSLLHVSEKINFGDILNKSTKINNLRYFVFFICI